MKKTKSISRLACAFALFSFVSALASETKSPPKANRNSGLDSVSINQQTEPALLSPLTGERVKWQVIAGGGNRGTSPNFTATGTAGQTAVGRGSSPNFGVNQGFWQNTSSPSCSCGDANGDGNINISDAVALIQYIFAGGPAPNPLCRGDANGDNTINISDAVYLIQYIFSGGPTPHCP